VNGFGRVVFNEKQRGLV